jgi:hypothetical protein
VIEFLFEVLFEIVFEAIIEGITYGFEQAWSLATRQAERRNQLIHKHEMAQEQRRQRLAQIKLKRQRKKEER